MAVYRRVGHNRAQGVQYIGQHVHIYTSANVPQAEQGQDIMCRFRTGAFLRGDGRRHAGRVMCGGRKKTFIEMKAGVWHDEHSVVC